jgi:hypothetical protein
VGNKAGGSFRVSAAQYSTFYCTAAVRSLSAVPVTGRFDSARYKAKKPMATPNSFVSVEGFRTRVQHYTPGRALDGSHVFDNYQAG